MPKRILIADDNATIRRLMVTMLGQSLDQVSFDEAGDGYEAIEKTREQRPDLIILDISMPELDGVKAARILKASIPDVPIVIFTMHDMGIDGAKMLGVDAVVTKVAGLTPLNECIQSLLPV